MVVSMLQEKETRQSDAKNWLAQDAATPEMVKKAGTMRFETGLCPLISPYYLETFSSDPLPWDTSSC